MHAYTVSLILSFVKSIFIFLLYLFSNEFVHINSLLFKALILNYALISFKLIFFSIFFHQASLNIFWHMQAGSGLYKASSETTVKIFFAIAGNNASFTRLVKY